MVEEIIQQTPTMTGASITCSWGGGFYSKRSIRWKDLLAQECRKHGDKLQDLIMTLTPEELIQPFNDDFGGTEGHPFTAWSENWVYFPVQYDGSEWVGSVPRNPCDIKTKHIGGG